MKISKILKNRFALLAVAFLCVFGTTKAQFVIYSASSLNVNAGNPGAKNTDIDNIAHTVANGFTEILGASLSTPMYSDVKVLPFAFQFNGVAMTHYIVSNTGILTFDTTLKNGFASPSNANLTSSLIPNNSIACFWENFTFAPPTGPDDKVYTKVYGAAPNRQLWIDWFSFKIGGADNAHFSLVLEEGTNKIYVVDKNLWTGSNVTATVGLKINATNLYEIAGSPNLGFGTGTSAIADNDYYTFTPTTIGNHTLTVGTGTINNAGNTYPTPYANNTWGAKHQFLITKAELLAIDTTPIIRSVGFDVVTVNGNALAGLNIKLKNTNKTTLTAIESGMTQVFNSSTYTVNTGWNMHVLDNQFQWDRNSNIVVEVCFNNNTAAANGNCIVNSSTTTFNSSINYTANNATICASNTVSQTYTTRPNIRINGLAPYTDLLAPTVVVNGPINNGCLAANRVVTATITDNDTVSSAILKYSINGGTTYSNITMTKGVGNTYSGTIPAQAPAQRVMFYVEAMDRKSNTNTPEFYSYIDQYLFINLGPDQGIIAGTSVKLGPNSGIEPAANIKITEFVPNAGGTGSQPGGTIPAYLPWNFNTDLIEITNLGSTTINMGAYTLEAYGSGAGTIIAALPATNVAPGKTVVYASGTGTNDTINKLFYINGGNNPFQSGLPAGIVIKKGSTVIDAVAHNNYVFNAATTGVTAADWSGGVGNGNGRAGVIRLVSDNNTSADWILTDNSNLTSVGVINPTLVTALDTNSYRWRIGTTVIDTVPYITVSPNVTTTYTLTVSDKVCSYTDTITLNIITYCATAGQTNTAFISKFNLRNINKSSGFSAGGYSYDNVSTTTLVRGTTTNPMRITPSYSGAKQTVHARVWIDFNKNGNFNDAGELVYSGGPDTANFNGSISIPANAFLGVTRMRVSLSDTAPGNCGNLGLGEVEDYNVTIVDKANDTDAPTIVSVSQVADACNVSSKNVYASVTDNYGVDSVNLFYSVNGGTSYTMVSMMYSLDSLKWMGAIPAGTLNVTTLYYVTAKDFKGNATQFKTLKFKDGAATIYAGTDTIIAKNGIVTRVAQISEPNILITEVLANRGQAGTQLSFPAYLPQGGQSDIVEFQNIGNYENDLSNIKIIVNTSSGFIGNFTKTFPIGTKLAGGQRIFLVSGSGTDDIPNHVYYLGGFANIFTNGVATGVAVFNGVDVLDAVSYNNYVFAAGTGVGASDFTGTVTIPGAGVAGTYRFRNTDNDDATDWQFSTSAFTETTLGALNPGMSIISFPITWKADTTVVSTTPTMTVSPLVTTSYVVSMTFKGCLITDTVMVTVDTTLLDVSPIEIISPNTYCSHTANEQIKVKVRNTGAVSVNLATKPANLTLRVFNGTGTVSYNAVRNTGVVLSGDTFEISVNNVNLSATSGNPINYILTAIVKVNSDLIATNDTLNNIAFLSDALIVNAGNDTVVPLGGSVTLNASSSIKKILISEIFTLFNGTGAQTSFPATYPNVNNGQDFVELTNVSPADIDISGYVLTMNSAGGGPGGNTVTYTFPTGTIMASNSIITFATGNVTPNHAIGLHSQGAGFNNFMNSGTAAGFYLKDNSAILVDAVALNGYTFAVATGVTAADWTGTVSVNGFSGAQRQGTDSNTSSDWYANGSPNISSIGAVNTGLSTPLGSIIWKNYFGATLGTGSSLTVTPTASTNYIAVLSNGICTSNDTVFVRVDSNVVDLSVSAITTNKPSCNLSANDSVLVKIKNLGAVNINFATTSMVVTLKVDATNYTRTISTGTLARTDSMNVIFTGVNLSSTVGVAKLFNVVSYLALTADTKKLNDTLTSSIYANKVGVDAGIDQTVGIGQTANLKARASGKVIISEFILWSSAGGGQTSAPAGIPWGQPQPDLIELYNPGYTTVDMSGFKFESYGNAAATYNYNFKNGTLLGPGSTIVLVTDTGTDNSTIGVYYMGNTNNNPYASGSQAGVVVKNPNNEVADALGVNGYTFSAATGVTAADWSGVIASSNGRAGVIRYTDDTNNATDWQIATAGTIITSIGAVNPGLSTNYLTWTVFGGAQISTKDTVSVAPTTTTSYVVTYNYSPCSVTDTVVVNVVTNFLDLKAEAVKLLNNPCQLTNNESVEVKVRSVGTLPANFATANLTLRLFAKGSQYTRVINAGTLNSGDSLLSVFTGVDLSGIGAYPAKTGVYFTLTMTGDANATNNQSDSISVGNSNISVSASATPNTIFYGDSSILKATAFGDLKITEVVTCANNAACLGGQTAASVPTGVPWIDANTDLIELSNLGYAPMSLNGITFYSYGFGPNGTWNYALPNITLNPGQTIILVSGTGTNIPASRVYYTGSGNNPYTTGGTFGITIRQGTTVLDALAYNNYAFQAASLVTTADWRGNLTSPGQRAGVFRSGADNNLATDWSFTDNSPALLTTIGALNRGYVANTPIFNWYNPAGNLVGTGDSLKVIPGDTTTYKVVMVTNSCNASANATVNVRPLPFKDMRAMSITTQNAIPVWNSRFIDADFKNFGAPVTQLVLKLTANGTTVVVDTVNKLLLTDSVLSHTFSLPWTPAVIGTFNLCAQVTVVGDINPTNDSTCKSFNSNVNTTDLGAALGIKYFPNPVNTQLTLVNEKEQIIKAIRITDLSGKVVFEKTAALSKGESLVLQLSNISQGSYFILVDFDGSGKNRTVGRFIIAR